MMCRTTLTRRSQRGFTLTELMVVVAIIGVLAVLGVAAVEKFGRLSRSSEAVSIIQGIRAAQESYRATHGSYLDVSNGDLEAWYPMANGDPGKVRYAWNQPGHPDYLNWRALNVSTANSTVYGFACTAGRAGVLPDASNGGQPTLVTGVTLTATAPMEPWYVVQAIGDLNGNDKNAEFVASSFNGELYSAHIEE